MEAEADRVGEAEAGRVAEAEADRIDEAGADRLGKAAADGGPNGAARLVLVNPILSCSGTNCL
jgi:hypothetical protein